MSDWYFPFIYFAVFKIMGWFFSTFQRWSLIIFSMVMNLEFKHIWCASIPVVITLIDPQMIPYLGNGSLFILASESFWHALGVFDGFLTFQYKIFQGPLVHLCCRPHHQPFKKWSPCFFFWRGMLFRYHSIIIRSIITTRWVIVLKPFLDTQL